ncbi:MAG: nucleotidyltransferase domain-containing protein [Hahellaceae bacterium]|nr:nucleotidyltransferase domain-containing protein [Hahellaceae bacterium]MCP5169616.1 nucleotidyltransferase domain-containing protein [Hahellaceae bacterium]
MSTSLVRHRKAELQARYGVTSLALFGSTARNTARPDSDVDIPGSFDSPLREWQPAQFHLYC